MNLRIINTNARSVGPKKRALVDCMEEQKINLALVTETWLQSNTQVEQEIRDLADEHNLGVITRNRMQLAPNGRQYGGVAIVYNKGTTALKPFHLVNPNSYEILAAVGTTRGIKGKIFVVAVYMPPNMARHEAESCIEFISDVLSEAKRNFQGCTLVVGATLTVGLQRI